MAAMAAGPAGAVDWTAIPGRQVILFYPGQASWEWALTQSDHSGAPRIREGKSCAECHRKEEAAIGQLIVSGKKLEPHPIPGKRGSIPVEVRMAREGDALHVHLRFPRAGSAPASPMDAEFPVKVAVMLNDGELPAARLGGCWAVCHDDLTDMASAGGAKREKYLAGSRAKVTRRGGGDDRKPEGDLQSMLAEGDIMEFWQAKIGTGGAVVPVSGHILAERREDGTPIVTAQGRQEGDDWVVEFSRPLAAAGPGHFTLEPGKTYVIGFAVHANHAGSRFHHVSLNHSLTLGGGGGDFAVP